MNITDFRKNLLAHFDEFNNTLSTETGDWVVKGFIDVYKNIYTISIDTKVISKIIELMLFPVISKFASEHGLKMVLCEHQNHYPDITFISRDKSKIALDLKSTYIIDEQAVNGFTLGAFTGYFRDRQSRKNITFPYEEYKAHFVLGVIYNRNDALIDEKRIYRIEELKDIVSVVKGFQFLLSEKWRIASDQPGSGNTKNIGSVKKIGALLNEKGVFANHGVAIFDDYWMNYLTEDMARAIESKVYYRNLQEYLKWRAGMKTRKRKR